MGKKNAKKTNEIKKKTDNTKEVKVPETSDNIWNKIVKWVKDFLSVRVNLIITLIILVFIIAGILFFVFRNRGEKFALNEIYDVFPEEVRTLYKNFVSAGCEGDLHLNIKVDDGPTNLENMDRNDLINYMFSYLDKDGSLTDEIDDNVFKNAEKDLFGTNNHLVNYVKEYNYGGYKYNLNNGKVVREVSECTSDITYVSHLYGYFFDKDVLSMDFNVTYMKNGILYDFNNNKLGEYDGDVTKLSELTASSSYYRIDYAKKNNKFKLVSVEWKNRS